MARIKRRSSHAPNLIAILSTTQERRLIRLSSNGLGATVAFGAMLE
jgi:hypothetical protein